MKKKLMSLMLCVCMMAVLVTPYASVMTSSGSLPVSFAHADEPDQGTSAPSGTDTPVPAVTDTPVPAVTDTPVPAVTDTPVPAETDTPEPAETDTPEPAETDTPVPTDENTPAPTDENTTAPAETDTPVPAVEETPVPSTGKALFVQEGKALPMQIEKVISSYLEDGYSSLESVAIGTASAQVPENGKLTLTGGSGVWQVEVEDGVWATIAGEDSAQLSVTAAFLKGLGGSARIRSGGLETRVSVTSAVEVPTEYETQIVGGEEAGQTPSASTGSALLDFLASLGNPLRGGASTYGASGSATTYTVVINYQFENGTGAASPYTATLAAGSNFSQAVVSPAVLGYAPDQETVNISVTDIQENKTYTVTYRPAEVSYTVKHYQQNVSDDNYTLAETEPKTGYTEEEVAKTLAKTYAGFTALLYDDTTKIAADGSTVVEIYYDRNYYLLSLNLDGGYGAEPVYARYGAPISVADPQRAGYTFAGWNPALPTTMLAGGSAHTAQWTAGLASFTVVFWYENADDEGFSVAGTYKPGNVTPGTTKNSEEYKDQQFDGRDAQHFTYDPTRAETVTVSGDGSTVLNVYFTRNTYTLTFQDAVYTLTCKKTEHEHSDACCKRGGTSLVHWGHSDRCCKLGLTEHTHKEECYDTSDYTITAKYGAAIADEFQKAPFTTDSKGIAWECTDSNKYSYALQTLDRMPGFDATFTRYKGQSSSINTIYYYVQKIGTTVDKNTWPSNTDNFEFLKKVDTYFNYATYEEEYHDILGFSRYEKAISFNESYRWEDGVKNFKNNELNLYYMRNSYKLEFYNYNAYVSDREAIVQYQAPLSSYYFAPDYPEGLEKNAYVFAGWYTSAEFYKGTEANLSTMTMPAADMILYAKWIPASHTVTVRLTAESPIPTEGDAVQTVAHRSTATEPDTPTNGKYIFVGWFYLEDGVEKAFDFSMPVTKDLDLYAKWSSSMVMSYTIHYQLEDGTTIAADTTGSALAGTTKTFDAKGGTELYADYQEGYFPLTKSHSMTLDINATEENDTNVFIFRYVQKDAVPYTVKYLNAATGQPVATEKTVSDNRKAVVTETFVPVSGMLPDAYQKRLVVSAEEGAVNEIIFYYTEDTTHAYYKITHYTENIAKDAQGNTTWTEYASSQVMGDIGETYSADPLTISGFTYDSTVPGTVASGELKQSGLELKLYYTRNEYPYEFRFLEYATQTDGSHQELHAPVTGSARYGEQVTQTALAIPGYQLVAGSSENQAIVIDVEDSTTATKNVKTFYYVEQTVDIHYVVVGDAGSGTLSNYQDSSVPVLNGSPAGSVPTAATNYRFDGWYTGTLNADGTVTLGAPVPAAWVDSTTNKLTPQKQGEVKNGETVVTPGMYVAATYYAKFVPDITTVTVKKLVSGNFADTTKAFTFQYRLSEDGAWVNATSLAHNGTFTIENVTIGSTLQIREKPEGYTPSVGSDQTTAGENHLTGASAADEQSVVWYTATVNGVQPNETITFTNNRTTTPDTGVLLDSLPYLLILAVVALGVVLMIVRRRRDDD